MVFVLYITTGIRVSSFSYRSLSV